MKEKNITISLKVKYSFIDIGKWIISSIGWTGYYGVHDNFKETWSLAKAKAKAKYW